MRILVVEDNSDAAQMLRDLLESSGHRVTIAETAPQALTVLRGSGADAVLCDIGLPGMSGYDLAQEIRSDPAIREVPLVALTGYGQPEDRKRTADAGFDDHLTKPADLDTLIQRARASRSRAKLNAGYVRLAPMAAVEDPNAARAELPRMAIR